MMALSSIEQNVGVAVNGINSKVEPIYRALHYEIVNLVQYCLVNPNISHTILRYPETFCLPIAVSGPASLKKMSALELETLNLPIDVVPLWKTPKYFIKRFIQHPFYDYTVYGIVQEETVCALLAIRVVRHNDSTVLRIVDFIGNAKSLSTCGTAFQNLMNHLLTGF